MKGIANIGIKHQNQANGNIFYGYSFVDQAGDQNTRQSIFYYCFLLASGVVNWSSKKKTSIALSNTKSKYMALFKATTKAIWICKLFLKLDFYKPH